MADAPAVDTSFDDLMIAQAIEKQAKSANRVKSTAVLAELVNFANSGQKSSVKNGANTYKYATHHKASRVVALIKGNKLLQAKNIYAIDVEQYGTVLVNTTSTPPASA